MDKVEIAKAYVSIIPSMEGAQKTISDELGKAAQTVGKETGEKLGEGINDSLKDAIGKTGSLDSLNKLSQMVGDTIGKIGDAALDSAKELDKGYDTIVQKTGATGDTFKQFQGIANNIFSELPEQMETVGAAVGEVNTRFKLTGEQLENTASAFTKFSKINNVDVSGSIDDVQVAMAAFNVSAADASKVLDVLTKTGQSTGADVGQLSKKISENATAFKELGLDIYGSIDFMGQLETAGADSQSVLSGLKRALKSATEEGKPLNDALAELEDTIKNGTGTTDGLTAAYELFGKSGAGIFEAVRNGQISFTDLSDSTTILKDATNSLNDAYEGTLSGWDKMTVATNNLKIAGSELTGAFFEAAAPAIDGLTGIVKDLTAGFQELPDEVKGVIGVIGTIGIEAGKIIPKIIEFSTQLSTLKVMKELSGDATGLGSGIGKLKGMLTSINPVFLAVAAAVAAAVAVFMQFQADVEHNTEAVRTFKAETETLYNSAHEAAVGVQELSTSEITAENAAAQLAAAQQNLQTLQNANADAATRAADATTQAATSVTSALAGQDVELGTFGQIINTITNGAYGLAVNAETAKERLDTLTESEQLANDTMTETDAALQLAQNNVAALTLLNTEMTESERNKTNELINAMDAANTSTETYQGYIDKIAAVNEAHRSTITALEEMKVGYETQLAEIEAEMEAYKESATNSLESVFGNFNTVKVETEKSVSDMITSLQSQVDYMNSYQQNLTRAMELGIDEGLVKKLSDGSMESAQILQAIVDDGGEHIDEFVQKFNAVEQGKQKFTDEVGEIANNFSGRMDEIKGKLDTTIMAMNEADTAYLAGTNTMLGYIKGLNDQEGVLTATCQRLAAIPQQVTRAVNAIKSPSRVMQQLGEYTGQGYANGIIKMIKPVKNASYKMAKTSINETKKAIKQLTQGTSSDYEKAGKNLIDKMNKSITNSLKNNETKLTKQVKRYFERYNLQLTKQEKQLQRKIDKIPTGTNATKTQKAQREALQKQLNNLKNYQSKFKRVQSQFGNNIAKTLNEALTKQTQKVTNTLTNRVNSYTKAMQNKINAVNNKISNMRGKLSDYGELFEVNEVGLYGGGVRRDTNIINLNDQIKTLKKYNSNLTKLKGKISSGLMDEITNMSVDDAISYSKELLKMSDAELSKYNKLYKEKQKLAKSISTNFYADEIKTIKTNYTEKIQTAFKDAQTKIKDFGTLAIKGFINGLRSVNVDLEVQGAANKIIKAFKKALKIKSPSKVFEEMGVYTMEGLEIGAENETKNVIKTYNSLGETAAEAYTDGIENAQTDLPTMQTQLYDFTSRLQAQTVQPYTPQYNTIKTTTAATEQPIVINVYGAEGQDINALANLVIQKINQRIQTREAVYA